MKLPPYFDMVYFRQMAEFNRVSLIFVTCINSLRNRSLSLDTEHVTIKPKKGGGFGGFGESCVKWTALANMKCFLLICVMISKCCAAEGLFRDRIFENFFMRCFRSTGWVRQILKKESGFSHKLEYELTRLILRKSYVSIEEFNRRGSYWFNKLLASCQKLSLNKSWIKGQCLLRVQLIVEAYRKIRFLEGVFRNT